MAETASSREEPGNAEVPPKRDFAPRYSWGDLDHPARDSLQDFDYWMRNVRAYRETTRRQYSQRIRRCSIDLTSATSQDLKKHFFSTHPGPSNRNQERHALIAYMNYLIDLGIRKDNPAISLPWTKEPDGLPNPIPKEFAKPLLDVASSHSQMFKVIVTVFLYTGLRLSEVCRLRWNEIQGEWILLETKGGQIRSVYASVAVQEALKSHPRNSAWVFPSPRSDSHISGSWVWKKLRDFGTEIGLDGCRPHRLRHLFGTSMWEQTRDLLLVQKSLGHKSIHNTVRYTLIRDQDVKEAVEQLRLF